MLKISVRKLPAYLGRFFLMSSWRPWAYGPWTPRPYELVIKFHLGTSLFFRKRFQGELPLLLHSSRPLLGSFWSNSRINPHAQGRHQCLRRVLRLIFQFRLCSFTNQVLAQHDSFRYWKGTEPCRYDVYLRFRVFVDISLLAPQWFRGVQISRMQKPADSTTFLPRAT